MERGGRKPGWWGDVGSFLAFEEEGEPEGELGREGRVEAFRRTLCVESMLVNEREGE